MISLIICCAIFYKKLKCSFVLQMLRGCCPHTLVFLKLKLFFHIVFQFDACLQILTSLSVGTQLTDDRVTTIEADLFFMYVLNAYDMHGRLNNLESQQHIVKSFAGTKACSLGNSFLIFVTSWQLGCSCMKFIITKPS